VGFAATEAWIRAVAEATGRDPSPALEDLRRQREQASQRIARHYYEGGYPKGAAIAIRADASFALPLTTWLHDYLGMVPVSVQCMDAADPAMDGRLREYLAGIGYPDAYGADPVAERPDLFLGDEMTGLDLFLAGSCREAIGLTNRTIGETEFVEKAFLGGTGALWILERVFGAVRRLPE
jgi:nitrogenase molybdenum-iron protein alpha/beta subunit